MSEVVKVALVGDYSPRVVAHAAIPRALAIAALAADVAVEPEWVATDALERGAAERLAGFHAVWCVPASPYASMAGALDAIRFAREHRRAFLGTCGGYQHAALEHARNVLGHAEADNSEVRPDAPMPLVAPLHCALVEKHGEIEFAAGSRIREIYGAERAIEGYHCSYGVNREYLPLFAASDLRFTGFDATGDPRAFEHRRHPFFLGTAYQPERSALHGEGHPLVAAFLAAARVVAEGGD